MSFTLEEQFGCVAFLNDFSISEVSYMSKIAAWENFNVVIQHGFLAFLIP